MGGGARSALTAIAARRVMVTIRVRQVRLRRSCRSVRSSVGRHRFAVRRRRALASSPTSINRNGRSGNVSFISDIETLEHGHVVRVRPSGCPWCAWPWNTADTGIAAERFFEPAAAEEGEDLARLTFDRLLDRRVVQDGDSRSLRSRASADSSFSASSIASWTNCLMISSPQGPSARRPKPPQNPLTPAKPMPWISVVSPSSGPRPRRSGSC